MPISKGPGFLYQACVRYGQNVGGTGRIIEKDEIETCYNLLGNDFFVNWNSALLKPEVNVCSEVTSSGCACYSVTSAAYNTIAYTGLSKEVEVVPVVDFLIQN